MEEFLQTYALSTQILKLLPQGEPTQFYIEVGIITGITMTFGSMLLIKTFLKYVHIGGLSDLH